MIVRILGEGQYDLDVPAGDVFPEANATLEGQIADLADRIAYNCHDLEDGMKARLFEGEQMQHIEIYVEARQRAGADGIDDWTIRRTRTAKAIIDMLVSDCIEASEAAIAAAGDRDRARTGGRHLHQGRERG